jgi:hypothetical protein
VTARSFEATVELGDRAGLSITVPFDPTEAWGARRRHYVRGTLNGAEFRGSLGVRSGRVFMPLNQELRRRAGVAAGDVVAVTMDADEAAEAEVPADLAGALSAAPAARECFEGLTPFQRGQYVAWVSEARRPETRAARVREAVELLAAGVRQRR